MLARICRQVLAEQGASKALSLLRPEEAELGGLIQFRGWLQAPKCRVGNRCRTWLFQVEASRCRLQASRSGRACAPAGRCRHLSDYPCEVSTGTPITRTPGMNPKTRNCLARSMCWQASCSCAPPTSLCSLHPRTRRVQAFCVSSIHDSRRLRRARTSSISCRDCSIASAIPIARRTSS